MNTATGDFDGDGISDKNEVASWVFPTNHINGGAILASDIASIGARKAMQPEVHKDTDKGGVDDGDEDVNKNGIRDAGETDPFDPSDDKKALDLVFCIDTTGSMGSDINQVKVSAVSIVNLAKSEFSDLRVALVGYKDFPDEDSAYLYYDYQDFTTNLSDAVTAINTLTVGGGGDTPEAVYSALMHTFDGTSLGGWRPSPVARAVITMGDAPPHDPEPHTGYTLADIVNKSAAGGAETTLFLPSKRGASKNAATVETNVLSGPISVYPVWVGGDYSAGAAWTNIAGGTGGSVVKASSSSDVPQQMVNQIEAIKKATSASLGVLGPGGQTSVRGLTTVVADASKSYDPNGCGIVTYEWDWNFDGVYDETTVTPVVKHAYPGGLTNSIKVRVTSVGGDSATALFALPAASPETAAVLSATMTGSIDRQTGLYYEKVVVTNTGTAAVSGFRISVAGLPANVLFVSGTGTDSGKPYVDFATSLAPGKSLTLNLAFYSLDRTVPKGISVSVAPATVTPPALPAGKPLAIRSSTVRADGKMAVEFDSISGRIYAVEYSADMVNWQAAQTRIKGNGGRITWIDAGPPDTASNPGPSRFYRVILLP